MMSGVVNVVETLAEYDILEFPIDDRDVPLKWKLKLTLLVFAGLGFIATSWSSFHCIYYE
jgi:hypothetical protein